MSVRMIACSFRNFEFHLLCYWQDVPHFFGSFSKYTLDWVMPGYIFFNFSYHHVASVGNHYDISSLHFFFLINKRDKIVLKRAAKTTTQSIQSRTPPPSPAGTNSCQTQRNKKNPTLNENPPNQWNQLKLKDHLLWTILSPTKKRKQKNS